LENNLANYARHGRQHVVCRDGMTCISREGKWRGSAALDLYPGSVFRVEHGLYPHFRFFTVFLSSYKKISQDKASIWALLRQCKMFIHTYIHTYIHTRKNNYVNNTGPKPCQNESKMWNKSQPQKILKTYN
jgi:hypothetical protein